MIDAFRAGVVPVDRDAAAAARARIDALTKPLGSLGRIEELAVRLCAIAGGVPAHAYERRAILIGAADHGVAAAGVSAYPSDVTTQMIGGFLAGHAAINAFARVARAEVYVADFGVRAALAPHPRLLVHRQGDGTANLAREAAIPRAQLAGVLAAGAAAFDAIWDAGPVDAIALGEMGIGNSTAAAALVAGFTGMPPERVAGRGTGIDDAGLARKVAAIAAGLARCRERTWDELASEVGGYEIVALAGAMLRAAAHRIPVVLDGAIVTAAALIAVRIAPAAGGYLVAAHRSVEPGHAIALDALGLRPLLDLELRLGEASGAALALPLLEAAARMVHEMRTFAEAGVATASEPGAIPR